jgi:hypothetical protein
MIPIKVQKSVFAEVQARKSYQQLWHFFPELSLTSLPSTMLEVSRAQAHGVEMLLLLLCDVLLCSCVLMK